MRNHTFALAVVLSASVTAGFGCSSSEEGDQASSVDSALMGGNGGIGGLCDGTTDCSAIARGAVAFFSRKIPHVESNGRSCADCHMLTEHFQLTPAAAEARYQALQARRAYDPDADDPLFRPIDADDFRVNGDNASDYSNLRQNGLIRITFKLPPNAKLVDDATGQVTNDTTVDIWRSVPSVLNVKISGPDNGVAVWPRGPNQHGGYQLDGRKDTLQNQALGAFNDHAQVQSAPSQSTLDDIAAFEQVLFSSHEVKTLADAVAAGTSPLPDIDPPLTADEQRGKTLFNRSCALCHGGAGMSTPVGPPPIRYHIINSSCARPVDQQNPPRWQFAQCPPRLKRNIRTYEITLANGTVVRKKSDDPGRFLLTGVTQLPGAPPPTDDWEKLDNAPLRGISKTAPYFHNNSAATLEDVVDHYQQMFRFIQANNPTAPLLFTGTGELRLISDDEKPYIVAYLKKL